MLRIVASLGTDHHRFDRLVDWLDDWVAEHAADVTVTLQHGHSRPSAYADNLEIVAREQLLDAMRAADVVITQAGPGSMVDAHDSGHLPVVVPRSRDLHEVVDDHQSVFADLMERLGDCVVARDRAALAELLDRATSDAAFLLRAQRESPAAVTAENVRQRMDRAVDRGPGWVDVERLREVAVGTRRTDGSPVPAVAPDAPVPLGEGVSGAAAAMATEHAPVDPTHPADVVAVLRFRPGLRTRARGRRRGSSPWRLSASDPGLGLGPVPQPGQGPVPQPGQGPVPQPGHGSIPPTGPAPPSPLLPSPHPPQEST